MGIHKWVIVICILFAHSFADAQKDNPTLLLNLNSYKKENVTDNPADQLVAVVNSNRTANKASSLYSNAGLACIALQYVKAYAGKCNEVGGPDAKKPADSEFAESFAPTCGVLASSLSPITGRLLGCQSKYVKPDIAFSDILTVSNRSLGILHNKTHTEVGAAVSGSNGGGPYFWCLLFSDGKTNSSFQFEGGVAKITRPGCFSGANDDCSSADDWSRRPSFRAIVIGALVAAGYAFVV